MQDPKPDLLASNLRLQEYFFSANITDDDLDYYLNYTSVLVRTASGTATAIEGVGGQDHMIELVDDYAGCGLGLHKIRQSVHLVHGILSLIICLAGCMANIVNIVVLSGKELRRTAINRILCSLAVADFLLMLEYIPFACHMYLFPGRRLEDFYSYPWAVFVLFHAHFTLVAHTVSIWLTLSLAFWRYEVLKNGRYQRRKSGRRCHQERCTRTIVMAYLGSVVLCIPSFILFGIEEQQVINYGEAAERYNHSISEAYDAESLANSTYIYKVNLNPIAKTYDGLIHKAHLWVYSVVMKLGPCLVLTVLTLWLVQRLYDAERHHQTLTTKLSHNNAGVDNHPAAEAGPMEPRTPQLQHHVVSSDQVSLTQQLEMRQLNTAMNWPDAHVQIIVTEATSGEVASSNAVADTGHQSTLAVAKELAAVNRRISTTSVGGITIDQMSMFECTSVVSVTRAQASRVETTTVDAEGQGNVGRANAVQLNSAKSQRHKHQTDRTTRMLVAVLVIFLITEIPQGVMALLSGILGRQFFTRCYSTGMGEILDLLALLNSAINFLLYATMSRQFRRAARAHFRNVFASIPPPVNGCCCCCGHRTSPGCCQLQPDIHQLQVQPIAISPSNPTRCTQL